MREKITFKPGQAVVTVIDQNEAKPVNGNKGPQYMRVCDNDERIMFADPELEQAIQASGAAAGDAIQIVQTGKGKTTTWEVAIIGDATTDDRRSRAGQLIADKVTEPYIPTSNRRQPAARPLTRPAAQRPAELGPGFEQQFQERSRQQQPAAPPERAREITSDAAELTAAFVAAIEATAAAEAYAARNGLREFNLAQPDTITRCAITLFIQSRSPKGAR